MGARWGLGEEAALNRMLVFIVAAAGALVLVVAAWHSGRAPELPPAAAPEVVVAVASTEQAGTGSTLTVYVTGEVVLPGLVAVPEGSRVADALAAAGGVTGGALLASLNLAAPVGDGMQIIVPSAADPVPAAGSSEAASDGKVAVNRATAEDLQRLPGVGPVLAERIVEHRDAFGPFGTVEDLLDVPGIGEGKLASLRDHVTIP